MRVIVKGGVWKNTEDEILKVAVMKYGKNQWARISSLLTRKTPKQCKARWYEWLDPSIKKTEWSKEEDEKLLHLAKLMPTQWRTIAPIVERTPAQCLERYQRLLDEAEKEIAGTNDRESSAADSYKKYKAGEIDPDPETKPARPDPVDMDEDEKEMLSEARARLANTQGKKAKRKARERQLEESRRLAKLQKRRELKAAGIAVANTRRINNSAIEDDYNIDIPFQRLPPTGPHDTSKELNRAPSVSFSEFMLSQVEGKRKADRESEEQKRAAKKPRQQSESEIEALRVFENEVSSKRAPLVLPQPVVSQKDIEELSKLGAKQVPLDTESETASNYAATPLHSKTPRAQIASSVRQQAIEIVLSKSMQTPLLGESEKDTAYLASKMQSSTPMTARSVAGGIFTPREESSTPSQVFKMRERSQKTHENVKTLQNAFGSLPLPKNDFKIVAPELPSASSDRKDPEKRPDKADLELQKQQKQEQELKDKKECVSSVITRGLPRPRVIPTIERLCMVESLAGQESTLDIRKRVAQELHSLMVRDWHEYPDNDLEPIQPNQKPMLDEVPIDWLRRAKLLIEQECKITENSPTGAKLKSQLDLKVKERFALGTGIFYDWQTNTVLSSRKQSNDNSLNKLYSTLSTAVHKAAETASKAEKTLAVKYGGYEQKLVQTSERILNAYKSLTATQKECQVLVSLKKTEEETSKRRIEEAEKNLERVRDVERILQSAYSGLLVKYQKSVEHQSNKV